MSYLFQKKRANSAITPLSFPDSDLWLDYSDVNSQSIVSDKIENITDKSRSGNDYEQPTAARRFDVVANAYNGLQVASTVANYFNSYMFTSQNYIDTVSDTWVIVSKNDDSGAANATIIGQYGDVSAKLLLIRSDKDSAQDVFWVRDSGSNILQSTPTLSPNLSILIATREPGKITTDYNDVVDTQTGTYAATTYLNTNNNPIIGAHPNFSGGLLGSVFFKGEIAEIVKYKRVLSGDEIGLLKSRYLKPKWLL